LREEGKEGESARGPKENEAKIAKQRSARREALGEKGGADKKTKGGGRSLEGASGGSFLSILKKKVRINAGEGEKRSQGERSVAWEEIRWGEASLLAKHSGRQARKRGACGKEEKLTV